jgi:radical SAM protein with 4Fe4S-binding SPASM domain
MRLPFSVIRPTEAAGPKAGLHSYLRASAEAAPSATGRGEACFAPTGEQAPTEERCKIHLRVEPDGSSLLLVNANFAYHLNPTASLLAWLNLEGRSQDEAIRALQDKYRVRREVARSDVARMWADIETLTDPEGACPIHDSELEVVPPFSQATSAPLRMDLALTYRCNDDCAHCYNARPRSFPEMPTEAWKQVLDRVRDIGVPHVCFTGGEATLRQDLPELTAHASSLGLVTGLLTNGRRLSDAGYVDQLVASGLDHVQITLESHDEPTHDRMVRAPGAWRQTVQGIRNALTSRLYVMTNTTLLTDNAADLRETLDFLAELGVPTIGCNALIHTGLGSQVGTGLPERSLGPLLEIAKERTEVHGQRLVWYTPTQYCHFDPVQGELGVKGCTAARYNMAVEPDGSVLPCQSYYQPLGNLLRDSWDSIWNHELSIRLRDKSYVGEGCRTCVFFQECGGGCPLSPPQTTWPLPSAHDEVRTIA